MNTILRYVMAVALLTLPHQSSAAELTFDDKA